MYRKNILGKEVKPVRFGQLSSQLLFSIIITDKITAHLYPCQGLSVLINTTLSEIIVYMKYRHKSVHTASHCCNIQPTGNAKDLVSPVLNRGGLTF